MSAPLPSTSPNPPAAATSLVESTVAPALFLLVPVFTLALVVLALYNRPRGNTRPQTLGAYAIIGILAVVSTLVGALPLGHSRTPQPTAVLQALLSFFLGLPVLHLVSPYAPSKANRIPGLLQRTLLVILLSTATLLALLAALLPSLSTACPRYLPSALFLAYSVLALPCIAVTLFRFLQRSSGQALYPTSISKPGIKLFLSSRRARAARRPITIHVETHRTSIPLSLPSPASSTASLPLSDPNSAAEQPIELEIAFPSGKEGRSRLKEGSIAQAQTPYQDEKKSRPESSSPKDTKHYQVKHEKTTSLDSTTSTITNFDTPRTRYRSHSPPLSCLPSSLPLVSLTSPPRAAYTAAFTADPDPPPFTSYAFQRVEEQIYQFPRIEGDSNENHEEASNFNEVHSRNTRQQLTHNRSRNLLVFVLIAQLTLVVAYACGVAAAVTTPEISPSISTSAIASFKTVQAACSVLAITATMSAYLLHAHNAQSSSSRRVPRSGPEQYRPSRSGPSPIQTIDASNGRAQPVVIHLAPPPPPKTRRKRADAFGIGAAPADLSRHVVDRYSTAGSNDSHGTHSESTSSSGHSPFNEGQKMHGNFVHDVSYTYPFLSQANAEPACQRQHQSNQHHAQNSQSYSLSREPITLTYEPPKLRRSLSGRSLTETTETEEGVDLDLDLDLDDLDDGDQKVNGNLDLECEMHRALSRTSSMASSAMSDFSSRRRSKIASATAKAPATAHKPKSKTGKAKAKKGAEDPALYIRKRGSLPPVPSSKKLFGWEFGWDPLPKGRGRGSDKEMKEIKESSFLDFRGIGRKTSDKAKDREVKAPMTPTRKLKRYSSPAGAKHHRTSSSREAAKMEKLEDLLGIGVGLTSMDSTTSKKLKKRSKSVSRSDEVDLAEPEPFHPEQLPKTMLRSAAPSSGLEHRKIKSTSTSASSGAATSRPGTADSKTSSSHGHRSSASLGGRSMKRDGLGLQLKKSFKLGVGRTLGPNLSLASAGLAYGETDWKTRKASKRDSRDDAQQSVGGRTAEEDDEDVHSVAAAKLVSASIARVMPAATILAAPSSPTTPSPTAQSDTFRSSVVGPSIPYIPPVSTTRPARPPIVTSPVPVPPAVVKAAPSSAPAPSYPYTPQSLKAPRTSGSSWRPHPFADPIESPARPLPIPFVKKPPVEPLTPSPEDDVLQLEREMEVIRRQSGDTRGDGGLDSPTAPFKELAAFAGGLPDDVSVSTTVPAPSMTASMTPSLNSIFAAAHAQAQTAAMPPLPPTTPKLGTSPEKSKGNIFGGSQMQKRMPLSAPPVSSQSVWGPQSSKDSTMTGSSSAGLPYKFPLIFPNSFSNAGSPPKPRSASANQQTTSTPSTPKGPSSTLRLSSMTMGTVRNVFAGVGARMSSATIRMSVNGASMVNGSAKNKVGLGHGFEEMIMEAGEGDFMDLTDPFAPPPLSARNNVEGNIEKFWEMDSEIVQGHEGRSLTAGQTDAAASRTRMSAWGKLPMPARPISPALSAVNGIRTETSSKKNVLAGAHRTVRIVGKPSRKHKKRSRRSTLLSGATGGAKANAEDADFGLEEALLSQRLLSRLDADGWEVQN